MAKFAAAGKRTKEERFRYDGNELWIMYMLLKLLLGADKNQVIKSNKRS